MTVVETALVAMCKSIAVHDCDIPAVPEAMRLIINHLEGKTDMVRLIETFEAMKVPYNIFNKHLIQLGESNIRFLFDSDQKFEGLRFSHKEELS